MLLGKPDTFVDWADWLSGKNNFNPEKGAECRVEDNPDYYQGERAKRLRVGQPAIRYGLKRLNVSYKKKALIHPKAKEDARSCFSSQILEYKSKVER